MSELDSVFGLSLRAELGLATPKVGGHRVRPQALGVIIWKKACAMGRGPINMEQRCTQ